jgi:cyclic pyranopterin phosphate synthase
VSIALPVFASNGHARHAPVPAAAPAQARRTDHLVDSHGRVIRDLRLSVTDRCNFRCVYCMDPDFRYMPKQQLLTLDEYLTLVRACLGLGITKVRITGGEPTLYPQINDLVSELGKLRIDDLAITTNGSLLDRMPLDQWRRDGLRRITFSLDSLRPERVQAITRTESTPTGVIRAIGLAREAGFDPIKVNAVIMRSVNDDEVADFADFAIEHGIDMRLIEFMPLDSSRAWDRSQVVSADEMLAKIRARHEIVPVEDDDPSSTSMNFTIAREADLPLPLEVEGQGEGGAHDLQHGADLARVSPTHPPTPSPDGGGRGPRALPRIGIIAPVTRPFCGACSRLRITADGKIRPCLFSLQEWDIKPALREASSGNGPAFDQRVRDFIVNAVWTKQAGHGIGSKSFTQPPRTMSAIGG